ncbi:MAG: hypothetical protein GX564_01450 [Oligosphaeraceae bacterium]|nr:hypothetical protein [Oligosphaeraceae bacterium]
MNFENPNRTFLVVLLFGNLLFFVAAMYSHLDAGSLREQLSETAAARDQILVQNTELQTENKRLKTLAASKPAQTAGDNGTLAKLEQLLDMRDAELAELKKQLEGNRPRNREEGQRERGSAPRNREGMQERMERLRTENPQEYARIQNFREDMQRRNQERIANRDNFFKNLDVSRMTGEQRELLTRYRDLLSANDELMAAGGSTDRDTMRENYQALRDMRESVQELLLNNLAERNGISAATLSGSVKDILEITGGGFGGGFGGGDRRGGRPQR